jgi:hypothetical protein
MNVAMAGDIAKKCALPESAQNTGQIFLRRMRSAIYNYPRDGQTRRVKSLLLILCLGLSSTALFGQTNPNSPTQNKPVQQDLTQNGIWNGSFFGGRYLVKSKDIIALSQHEYVADAAARVVEINLTLSSNTHVRFYYLEPVKLEGGGVLGASQEALQKAREMVENAAGNVSPTLTQPKVVKSYPLSTHAHTVEFVIKDEARLNSLFNSLENAFRDPTQKYYWRE